MCACSVPSRVSDSAILWNVVHQAPLSVGLQRQEYWSTVYYNYPAHPSWNEDCWEKYQQPRIWRWYHFNGRKWRETKEPFDESKRVESEKACLKFNIQKIKIMASSPSWTIWWMMIFYSYLVCFTFSISYSMLPFH